jgi:hypothetical protein
MTMLKPKKKEDDSTQQPTRLRLPTESAIRDYEGIKALLEEAREKRGCLIELPWAAGSGKRFVLTVQWEKHMNEPIWTLYEETDSESNTVWCQPFPPSDMSFMFDVLTMSTGTAATLESHIPANLRPSEEALQKLEQEKLDEQNSGTLKPKSNKSAAEERASLPAARPAPSAPAPAAPAPAPAPAPQQAMPPPLPQMMPPQPYPGQMPPPMPYPPGYAYAPMPQQPYPPGYPPPPAPLQYPGSVTPPHGYPVPQQLQSQGWGLPAQHTPPGMPAMNPSIDPVSDPVAPSQMGNFLKKAPGILIGSLLTEAGLITEPTLEAALKIQELVRGGKLTPSRAPELLKLFYSMGASIEEYIDPSDLSSPEAAKKPQPTSSEQQRRAAAGQQPKELTSALDLLIKAGLLTPNDIKTASAVRAKHGGDLRMILQAAGKADTKTLDAAVVCVGLERQDLMKVEQCVILLNYCSRSRVGFDEAIDELGWPNPRKQKR